MSAKRDITLPTRAADTPAARALEKTLREFLDAAMTGDVAGARLAFVNAQAYPSLRAEAEKARAWVVSEQRAAADLVDEEGSTAEARLTRARRRAAQPETAQEAA